MTEDEAMAKRCCGPTGCGFGRAIRGTLNPDGTCSANYLEVRFCIGSACMAWRKTGQIGIRPDGVKTDRDPDGLTKWIDAGHCGLAGKP